MTDLHNMVRKVVLNIATTPKILELQHRVDFVVVILSIIIVG